MAERSPHHDTLLAEAVTVLNRYTHFSALHRVTFSLTPDGRLAGHLERTDGTPIPTSDHPLDKKLVHLKDQTVVIRPFFLAMSRSPWDEKESNAFTQVDFDYAAILGYQVTGQEEVALHALYFLPTSALLYGRKPGPDGVWKLPLGTYGVHRLSLDPRKTFARSLYLSERMVDALEYQYDTVGYFYSCPPQA